MRVQDPIAARESRNAPVAAARGGRALAENEIEVWRAALDEQPDAVVEALRRLLSSDEIERARRFFFERDRRRFVVGRGILRSLLANYLGRAPEEIVFHYGPNEKPALAGSGVTPPLFFNLAHSEGLALLAFTPAGEIGIDVERIREIPDWESIAEVSFSPEELARVRSCPPKERQREFFHAWTRQEALLKAAGTGLVGARDCSGEFQVRALDLGRDFVGALAVPWSAGQVLVRSFTGGHGRTEFRAIAS